VVRRPKWRPRFTIRPPAQIELPFVGAPFSLTPPDAELSENDVEAQMREYFARRGWIVIRQHVGLFKSRAGQYIKIGEKGMTDYLVLRPVRPGVCLTVYVEVKRPGAVPSEDQVRWMRRARAMGNYAESFDSVESLARWFEARFGPRLDRLLLPSGTAAPSIAPQYAAAGWRLVQQL
jgi:hypothetical protein